MNKVSLFMIPAAIISLLLFASCNQKDHKEASSTQTSGTEVKLASAAVDSQQLCSGHKAPKNVCFICDPSLRDPKRLWCNEHNRYEDRCFICHPEIQDSTRLYCNEHGVYEDECVICHPEITKG